MIGGRKVYKMKEIPYYSTLQYSHLTYGPIQVGSFSINANNEFVECDTSNFPLLPQGDIKLPLDLDEGYDPTIVKEYENSSGKCINWIQKSQYGYKTFCDVDIVTQRNVLRRIGYMLYSKFDNNWKFEACKFKDKLYVWATAEVRKPNPWGERNSYWGQKFESYVLDTDGKFSNYCVLKGKIGTRNVLLHAEVDAATAAGEHVEIKTCFSYSLADKIKEAWLQSYLAGIDLLYYGFKTKQGKVLNPPKKIQMSQVISNYVRVKDAKAMFGLIGDVLEWIYTNIPNANETWIVEYQGGLKEIILKKLSSEELLPSSFVDFVVERGEVEEDLRSGLRNLAI